MGEKMPSVHCEESQAILHVVYLLVSVLNSPWTFNKKPMGQGSFLHQELTENGKFIREFSSTSGNSAILNLLNYL